MENINVYLFSSSGAYMGVHQATDALGQVTFNLPEQDYKVRADYLSGQYWSEVFNAQDVDVDIAHGFADIHVTDMGMDVYDAPVYLFTDTGSYLGRVERTDSAGRAGFLLPSRPYKFRVDYNGSQYWSDVVNVLADEETEVSLALDLLALDLTHDPNPVRFDGVPLKKKSEPVLLASLFDIQGILAGVIVANPGGGDTVYYYINDHLDTPQKIMDEGGQVVWAADYKPFGEANVTTTDLDNNFRFPGQYYDAETGLHYNYHRYYDPMTGRYLTPDPIGLDGGMNLFLYSRNDPVNWIDPFGLKGLAIEFGGGAGTFLTGADTAGSGFYIGAKVNSPSGIPDGYAEIGAFTNQQRGDMKVGGKVTLGVDITYYNVDAEQFFQGINYYKSWHFGPATFTTLHDKSGKQIGVQGSLWTVPGLWGVGYEEGVSEGQMCPLQ